MGEKVFKKQALSTEGLERLIGNTSVSAMSGLIKSEQLSRLGSYIPENLLSGKELLMASLAGGTVASLPRMISDGYKGIKDTIKEYTSNKAPIKRDILKRAGKGALIGALGGEALRLALFPQKESVKKEATDWDTVGAIDKIVDETFEGTRNIYNPGPDNIGDKLRAARRSPHVGLPMNSYFLQNLVKDTNNELDIPLVRFGELLKKVNNPAERFKGAFLSGIGSIGAYKLLSKMRDLATPTKKLTRPTNASRLRAIAPAGAAVVGTGALVNELMNRLSQGDKKNDNMKTAAEDLFLYWAEKNLS